MRIAPGSQQTERAPCCSDLRMTNSDMFAGHAIRLTDRTRYRKHFMIKAYEMKSASI